MKQDVVEVPALNIKSAAEYDVKAVELTGQVSKLIIKDQETYEGAANLLKTVKAMANDADAARKKITICLDEAKAGIMDLFRPITTRLDNSERLIKGLMIAYTDEQERIRLAQEEKLRKEAEAKEALEKKRLEDRAIKAEASGKTDKADDLRQQAQEVQFIAPTLAPRVQSVSGVSYKKIWKARIVDPLKVPRGYLMVDEKKLDAQAKATQDTLGVPGVEFYFEKSLASR